MDPALTKNRIWGFVPQTKEDLWNVIKMNILDNFKPLLFCFQTQQKKKGIWNYLNYSLNRILKIFLCSRHRAPNPVFLGPKPDPHPWLPQHGFKNHKKKHYNKKNTCVPFHNFYVINNNCCCKFKTLVFVFCVLRS